MPIVSIVIPTYNSAEFIVKALDSVFAQSYQDFEIIIVDDGSTDSTRRVLIPYSDSIRYYYQDNQGVAAARNKGLKEARCDFVAFLDSDDVWDRNNLEAKMEILTAHDEMGAIFSDFRIFGKNGVVCPRGIRFLYPFLREDKKDFEDIFCSTKRVTISPKRQARLYCGRIFESLFQGNFMLSSTIILRKRLIDDIGEFRTWLRTQEDYEYWLRFSKKYLIGYIDDVFVSYRRRKDQLTSHANMERILMNVLEIVDEYQTEFCQDIRKRKFFNKRKSQILLNLAKLYIGIGHRNIGKQRLLECIKLYPYSISSYIQLGAMLIPHSCISFIRSVLRHRLGNIR